MTSGSDEIFLSVLIPAFNEQERIADSLYAVKDYLAKRPWRSEILIVDDGSSDMTTEVVRTIDIFGEEMMGQETSMVMENIKNVGKGFSIARGMLRTRGTYVIFSDADLSTPIEEVEKLLPLLEGGWDVVIGSRRIPGAEVEKKPWYRKIMSSVFHLVVSMFAVRGIHDTQCGFKGFRRKAAHHIARLQRLYGFSFDVEQLYLARKLGYGIREVPVRWQHQEGSTVDPLRDTVRMLVDVMRIRWMHRGLQSKERHHGDSIHLRTECDRHDS